MFFRLSKLLGHSNFTAWCAIDQIDCLYRHIVFVYGAWPSCAVELILKTVDGG
jgi:hypothetical protein